MDVPRALVVVLSTTRVGFDVISVTILMLACTERGHASMDWLCSAAFRLDGGKEGGHCASQCIHYDEFPANHLSKCVHLGGGGAEGGTR